MATWLREHGFDGLNAPERSRALAVLDHVDEIQAWRAGLTEDQQRTLNHPNSIWARWQASKRPKAEPRAPTQQDAIALGLSQDQLSRAADAVFDCLQRGVNDATIIATCALRAACMPPRIRPSRQRQREAEMRAAL
jgi:hypothetical protein